MTALDARLLNDAYERLRQAELQGGTLLLPPELAMHVHKMPGFLPVPIEVMLDHGLITEEQARAQGWTPLPLIPWLARLRWRWQETRERLGYRVGSWIAGFNLFRDSP